MLLSLSDEEKLEFLSQLSDEEATAYLYNWELWARPNQLEPDGDWTTWLILAGRGFGKTRTGSETIIKWARTGTYKRIALIAEDAADARDVMVEGESGIIACSPPDFMPKYEPSKKRLTWPNGAIASVFSADDYESLRGPQFDAAWCDELAKWRYAQEAWDNLQFGLRLGQHPKQIITTTPKPIKLLKDIIKRDDTIITKGSTMENLDNLAAPFRRAVVDKYMGTRIGRQELEAEILDDIAGAMWSRKQIDEDRIRPKSSTESVAVPDFAEIVISVDPATKSEEENDETGILVVAKGYNGRGYVLEDASFRGTPDEWSTKAVELYDKYKASYIIYESNQGGDMVKFTLQTGARMMREGGHRTTDFIPLKEVHASRGKAVRAEPISLLYEQHKVSHIGTFAELEDQMCEFTTNFDRATMKYSPDRVDALVWGFTYLLVDQLASSGLMEYYRQEAEAVQARLNGTTNPTLGYGSTAISTEVRIKLKTNGSSQAYGMRGTKYDADADGYMLVLEEDVVPLMNAGFTRANADG